MPITLDISDTALERHEFTSQLHLWGVHIPRWDKTVCCLCGKDAITRPPRTCFCREVVFCGDYCKKEAERSGFRQICAQLDKFTRERPSTNHRRALLINPRDEQTSLWKPIWIEIRDDKLVIDHPALDEHFREAPDLWFQFSVINSLFYGEQIANSRVGDNPRIGHGIVIGYPSNMMSPGARGDLRWLCRRLMQQVRPGYLCQWPGPLVFFAYAYDVSDYVKVNDVNECGSIDRGAEAGMTDLQIEAELAKVGRDVQGISVDAPRPAPPTQFWKWKVRERGTSMKILDMSQRDLGLALLYFCWTALNPHPAAPLQTVLRGCKVSYIDHPGHRLISVDISKQDMARTENLVSIAPRRGESLPRSGGDDYRPQDVLFQHVRLRGCPKPVIGMAGAFAVGLRWYVKYIMEVNPPFRNLMGTIKHSKLAHLMWGVEPIPYSMPAVPNLGLWRPGPFCDGVLIFHPTGTPVFHHHVNALLRYLEFTPPTRWSQHGPQGFQNYWQVYARNKETELKQAVTECPESMVPDPYSADALLWNVWHGRPAFKDAPSCVNAHDTIYRGMTLEGIDASAPGYARLKQMRDSMLETIQAWRDSDGTFTMSGENPAALGEGQDENAGTGPGV